MYEGTGVWVGCAIENGKPIVGVQWDMEKDPIIIKLNGDDALQYALGCYTAAQRAEYDAAVMRQLTEITGDATVAGGAMVELREGREEIDQRTAPINLVPGVAQDPKAKGGFRPFIALIWITPEGNRQIGQWEVDDAREHGAAVMEAIEATEMDERYTKVLMGSGVDETKARRGVADLRNYR